MKKIEPLLWGLQEKYLKYKDKKVWKEKENFQSKVFI